MQYEKIIYGPGNSFSYKDISKKFFPMPLHIHPEIEILLITSGHGKRFVGNSVDEFRPGDLVMYGDNLPHFHLCDKVYYEENDLYCSSRVIHFTRDIFPEHMSRLQEFANITSLLKKSKYGIKFTNPPSIEVAERIMSSVEKLSGIKRINTLFRILDLLGQMKDYKLLTEYDYSLGMSELETNTTATRVYRYLIEHFKRELSLKEIALNVNQNPTSLCRYYKRNTKKSVFETLIEIRIDYACKLLQNSDFTVSQVAYESGYDNLSNFNKQFKKIMGMPPRQYRDLAVISDTGATLSNM